VVWSVAAAVTTCPLGTFFLVVKVKVASPLEFVVTLFWPRNFLPSTYPVMVYGGFGGLSASALPKNCKVKVRVMVVLGVVFSAPLMMVTFRLCPPIRLVASLAEVISGKFCRLLGPVCGRPVTDPAARTPNLLFVWQNL
jgi:hypothetical protein